MNRGQIITGLVMREGRRGEECKAACWMIEKESDFDSRRAVSCQLSAVRGTVLAGARARARARAGGGAAVPCLSFFPSKRRRRRRRWQDRVTTKKKEPITPRELPTSAPTRPGDLCRSGVRRSWLLRLPPQNLRAPPTPTERRSGVGRCPRENPHMLPPNPFFNAGCFVRSCWQQHRRMTEFMYMHRQ